MIFTRTDVEATLLRASGALFQQMPDGHFSNLYTVKVVNKTRHQMPIQLRLEKPAGQLLVMGHDLLVPGEKLVETSLLIELNRAGMKNGTTPISIGVYCGDHKISTVSSAFIGPRDDAAN
jgi:hypothetical protein